MSFVRKLKEIFLPSSTGKPLERPLEPVKEEPENPGPPAERGSVPAPQVSNEFETLGLPASVLAGVLDAGFVLLTPIQRKTLPITLAGGDLCGQAQTGTGKTATFLITFFSRFLDQADPRRRHPIGLVLAPTRELAQQIHREGVLLGAHTGLRLTVIYGGEGFARQEQDLRSGVDLVVGTPGRLLDFIRRGVLDVSKILFLVIDEADRLLDMGFWDELREILRKLPPPRNRQSMLFSATLDHPSKKIASSYMNHPVDVAVKPEQVTAEGIDQMVYHVAKDKKFRLLLGILSREEVTKGLIFANMKITVTWLARKLKDHGYQVEMLTGDMAQQARNRVLDRFKRGSMPLLVASDVASRGLHIEDVTHIINYDVPQDPEDYVHRIGRTARAGKRGKAYSLACDDCCWYLPAIEDLIGAPLPNAVPQDEDFGEDRSPSFTVRRMLALERQGRRDADRSEQARRQSRPAARRSSTVGKGPSERRDAPPPRSNRRQPSRQRKKEPGAAPTS